MRRHLTRQNLHVETPCAERWEEMLGDNRARFCGRCQKHVYNLSAMSAEEAEALLAKRRFGLCIRYAARPDGTLVTDACPPAQSNARAPLALTTAALVATVACAGSDEQPVHQPPIVGVAHEPSAASPSAPQPPLSATRADLMERGDIVMGRFSEISRALRRADPALMAAYRNKVASQRSTDLWPCCDERAPSSRRRKVSVKLRIDARGDVERVDVNVAPRAEPALNACVTHLASLWRFPAGKEPSDVEAYYECEAQPAYKARR